MMMYNEIKTIQLLKGVKTRICDRRFYTNRKQRGEKWYYGWICFEKPLDLYDAMIAGLVPIFRNPEGRKENDVTDKQGESDRDPRKEKD